MTHTAYLADLHIDHTEGVSAVEREEAIDLIRRHPIVTGVTVKDYGFKSVVLITYRVHPWQVEKARDALAADLSRTLPVITNVIEEVTR